MRLEDDGVKEVAVLVFGNGANEHDIQEIRDTITNYCKITKSILVPLKIKDELEKALKKFENNGMGDWPQCRSIRKCLAKIEYAQGDPK